MITLLNMTYFIGKYPYFLLMIKKRSYDELINRTYFENSMRRLEEIKREVEEDIDREAET